jgi:hypothetical protein
VSFKEAVEQTPHLANAWKPGLQALRARDRPHIQPQDSRRLRGSVDIDEALRAADPDANRWDFGIAHQHANRADEFVYWVELHTANDAEVKIVLQKALWLRQWLAGDGHRLRLFEREIIWLSSGATTFTLNAPQRKQMAEVGLMHKGSHLRIPNQYAM